MSSSGFNPYHQNITFVTSDGTPFNVSVADIDDYVQDGIVSCIDSGVQLGASVVTLLMLLLLTRPRKRRSAVFLLNTAALSLNIVRIVCEALYFTGAFFETYGYFSGDFSAVKPVDYVHSIMGMVCLALLTVTIQCSLIMQIMAVCADFSTLRKRVFMAVCGMVAIVPTGFRFAQMVLNAKYTVEWRPFTPYIWLQKANTVVMTVSICFFSAVFMSIFAILQFVSDVPEINANIFSFVVISLPATSLWATAALPGQSTPNLDHDFGQPLWNILSSHSAADIGGTAVKPQRRLGNVTSPSARIEYKDLEDGRVTVSSRHDSLFN